MNARVHAALVSLLLILPAGAAAQTELEVRVSPQAGILTPAEWFYYQVTVYGEGPMEWTEAALLRSKVVGLSAEVRFGDTGIWLRGNALRTLDGETYIAFAVLNSGPMTPPTVVRQRYWVPTEITMASLDVGLPTRLRLPFRIQPYIVAGLGAKHFTFDRAELSQGDEGLVAPEDGTELMVNVGGGAVVPVWRGIELDVQVRDALSEYWDDQQHDVTWVAGLSWRVF